MSNSGIGNSIRRNAPVPMAQCGAACALEILSDRWTMLIIREAFYGVMRYEDMRDDIGIPRSVLTQRLKRLTEAEVLERMPYREEGERTRYGYRLTSRGQSLGLTLLALMQWGDEELRDGSSAIALHDKETGARLRVGLVREGTSEIPLSSARITPQN
ncbi:helix-turn-helix domain-containing protein [Yoonia sp. I 8.24]|uniref:winged helix-turn-helix transcriptional regulator n=1 Tax=Yoonia sp. I 8.24 TaxID=1537229 RepID=UPI001EE0507D|nr:helix-turn-helix domain-containing protein [Yoonia sp. I 8.24]